MAGNISNYLENKLLDHSLGTTDYTMPTVYLALHTADPGETGSLAAEVPTAGGTLYARQAIAFDAADSGTTDNTDIVTFPEAGASWGTISHVSLVDSDVEAAGNVLWYGELTTPKLIDAGDQFRVKAGDIDVSLN